MSHDTTSHTYQESPDGESPDGESPDGMPPDRLRTVVSYVRRGDRMTAGQSRAWEQDWPAVGTDVVSLPPGPLPITEWYGRAAPLTVEVGSGMGESTVAMAAARPDENQLAVEVYTPGLAQTLLRMRAAGVANLRLLRGDAVTVLRDHVPPGSLAGIRVFFPDPWPKRRHRKRRLLSAEFVALAASRLTAGGLLHVATDWPDYAVQVRDICMAEALLRPDPWPTPDGWTNRPEWRPMTKFERRARAAGRPVRDLVFHRY
jgi:tRNA (guanine-N7-)-methyltransferase